MPWGMAQRNKHLPRAALLRTHIVFDNRVSAIISAFIAQPFKYPLGCMALLARAGLIFCQPTIDLRNIRIKLGPLDRRCPPIPRRFGIRQHLRNTVSADPKIPSNLTPTQPVLKVSVTNLQIQIHGEYPQALPNERSNLKPLITPSLVKLLAFPNPLVICARLLMYLRAFLANDSSKKRLHWDIRISPPPSFSSSAPWAGYRALISIAMPSPQASRKNCNAPTKM